MADEFIITLHSDGAGNYQVENTPSTFTNKLFTRLSLSGNWECALIDLVIPSSLCNVYSNRCKTFVFNERSQNRTRSVIGDTYIKNPYIILDILNTDFSQFYNFEIVNNRFKCTPLDEANSIRFSKGLAMQLGFPQGTEYTEGVVYAPEEINFDIGLPSQICVTSDIVKPQAFGSKTLRLLRSVTLDIKKYAFGGSISFQPRNPIYVPLAVSEVEHISIGLMDDEHHSLSFLSGRSTLLLHLRRSRRE